MELLSVSSAAALLSVRPSAVRAWILRKQIPFVKIGPRPAGSRERDTRAVRIEKGVVLSLIEKRS